LVASPSMPSTLTSATVINNASAVPVATRSQTADVTTAQHAGTLDPETIVVVNGQAIHKAEYDQQLAQARSMYIEQAGLDPNSEAAQQIMLQLRQQVRDSMIGQVLLQQAATARNILITDDRVGDEIARMKGNDNAKFAQWMQANGLSEGSLHERLYTDLITAAVRDAIVADLSPQQVHIHARYIFTTDQATISKALARLQAGDDFTSVVRLYSMDETTRENGGDLGFIPQGVMPLAFDQVAFTLKADQLSDVVTVDAGYVIIQVLEIDPLRTVSDDNWPLVQKRVFETWLAQEYAQADITYNPAFD
jgi:foldase protein PrsA